MSAHPTLRDGTQATVIDASALLALLNNEPGAEKVAHHLPHSLICSVNHSEVVAKLAEIGMDENLIRKALNGLGLQIIPFDETLSFVAGFLRPKTKTLGLSLGDRACLALALTHQLKVLTADRDWPKARLGIAMEVIR